MRLSVIRYTALLCLSVLLAGPLSAQKALAPPIKFGSVGPADFVPAPAAADTAAAVAEYLCDYGTSRVVGSRDQFQVVFERTTRLQIHRKAGYGYATVRVPLYTRDGRYERLTNLRGNTYNLQEGRVVQTKLAADPAFREQLDKNHVQLSFTMPNVREGAIVEFSYTITSDFIFNLQDWQFEHTIPVRWSEYRATLPQFYQYKTITRGFLPFAVKEETVVPYFTTYTSGAEGLAPGQENRISGQALQLRWVMKDVPAFRTEPFLTTPHDYMRSVHFELAGTDFTGHDYHDMTGKWPALWQLLQKDEDFGLLLSSHSPLAAEAAALLRQHDSPKVRAAAVLALVQHSVQYDGHAALFGSQPLRRTLERRLGNAADVNLLLVNTLRAAGLPATPLLLSTRSHGQMQQLVPALSQFNYVAAHVCCPTALPCCWTPPSPSCWPACCPSAA
jgi:transglutaminase-like putative cysteine protease